MSDVSATAPGMLERMSDVVEMVLRPDQRGSVQRQGSSAARRDRLKKQHVFRLMLSCAAAQSAWRSAIQRRVCILVPGQA
jgi:hypothetical protein